MTGPPEHDRQGRGRGGASPWWALGGVAALGPACHRDVPGIDGVVLTVFVASAGWIILSDSGPDGEHVEDLHATLGEGPRVNAAATGRPVAVVDLAQADVRWPRFAVRALTCGVRAVFAFPVPVRARTVGVLSVYRHTVGPLSVADHDRVASYARTAAVLLVRTGVHVNRTGQASMPLPTGAGEVQQAVGVVMEHATVDAATALHRLRAYAHHSRRPMRDVVTEVRTGHLPFDPTTPA